MRKYLILFMAVVSVAALAPVVAYGEDPLPRVVTLALEGPAIYMPQDAVPFSGRIFNEASGLPIASATIDVLVDGQLEAQTRSDLHGRFAFKTVLSGDATRWIQAVYQRGPMLEGRSAELAIKPGQIDQQQPEFDYSVGGRAIGGQSHQKLAQVITPGKNTTIEQVRAPIACDRGSILIVELLNVDGEKPGSKILARAEVPAEELPTFWPARPWLRPLWITATPVTEGEQIAVSFHALGSCGMFQGPIGDSYAMGSGFYWTDENGPKWVKLSTREDLPFQTVVPSGGA